jgi:hypothetical protein
MATTLIRNGCLGGALAGIMMGRQGNSFDPTAAVNTSAANVADAIAAECITRNAALGAPMADADNANIFLVCFAAAYSVMAGSFSNDTTAADYLAIANNIVALAKASVAKLV